MPLDDASLDLILRKARSHNGWLPKPLSDAQIRELYELLKWGPTTSNSAPARFVFVRTEAGKQRVAKAMAQANVEKTVTAPLVVIIGYDPLFYKNLPRLFKKTPSAITWFQGEDKKHIAESTAFRNSSLQGAYLLIAARALGLDCGPMSGFDNAAIDREFFAGTEIKSNFICLVGYGDRTKLIPADERMGFAEACTLV